MKYSKNTTLDKQYLEKYGNLKSTVIPRAIILSLVIGSIINLVNQYDALFSSNRLQLLQLMQTYLTAFAVVLYAQCAALNRALSDIHSDHSSGNMGHLLSTPISHGIPKRAFVIGLVAGSINTAILFISNYINSGGINELPISQIVQFYLIPLFFGVLTQTLFYQRTISIFNHQEDRTIM